MVSPPTGCSTYSIPYTLKGLSRHVNIFKDTSNGTERSSFFPFRFELTVDQLVLDSRRTLKDIMGGSEKKKKIVTLSSIPQKMSFTEEEQLKGSLGLLCVSLIEHLASIRVVKD